MKFLLIVLVSLMIGSVAIGIPVAQSATSHHAEVEATLAASRAADPSLNVYHQLLTLRASMVPTWKDAETYTKSSDVQRRDVFIKLWNFRIAASQIQDSARADGINPDVRQAAESTWQELDEIIQGLTATDVTLLSTGDFGKGLGAYRADVTLTSLNNVTEHMENFANLNTTAVDALNAYAAAYTADHGVMPS